MSFQSHPKAPTNRKWLRPIAILIGLLIGAAYVGLPNDEWSSVTRIIPGFLLGMCVAFGMITKPESLTRATVLFLNAPLLIFLTVYISMNETLLRGMGTGTLCLAIFILQYVFATIANGEPNSSHHTTESSLKSHAQ